MSRNIQLIVFNSPSFPAHWALFIPYSDSEHTGTLVHAVGDEKYGYETCFERNYNIEETDREYQSLQLATVSDMYVEDFEGGEEQITEPIARDYFEQIVLVVPPPGRGGYVWRHGKPERGDELQNDQTWLKDVVAALVQEEVIDESAIQIINNAPRN